MHCERCHGLMVVDYFLDMRDDTGHLWLRAWRCVNCGAVAEPGMTARRAAHRTLFTRLRERWVKQPVEERDAVPIGV